jgi:hypothetical protein
LLGAAFKQLSILIVSLAIFSAGIARADLAGRKTVLAVGSGSMNYIMVARAALCDLASNSAEQRTWRQILARQKRSNNGP